MDWAAVLVPSAPRGTALPKRPKHQRTLSVMTRKARERSYDVQMAALAEEARVLRLSPDKISQRQREIYESCFEENS